ncbi:MAG: hypothetical protein ACJZ9G_01640 [Rhodospirillales bacterium]
MKHIFENAPVKIREDLFNAIGFAHSNLGVSGDWILGLNSVKIIKEVRNAQRCNYHNPTTKDRERFW